MRCMKCGSELISNAVFCTNCGQKVPQTMQQQNGRIYFAEAGSLNSLQHGEKVNNAAGRNMTSTVQSGSSGMIESHRNPAGGQAVPPNPYAPKMQNKPAPAPKKTYLIFVIAGILATVLVVILGAYFFFQKPPEKPVPSEDILAESSAQTTTEKLLQRDALIGNWVCYEALEPGSEDDVMFFCYLHADGTANVGHAVPCSDVFFTDYYGTWEMTASSEYEAEFQLHFPGDELEITATVNTSGESLYFYAVKDNWLELRSGKEYRRDWNYFDWVNE